MTTATHRDGPRRPPGRYDSGPSVLQRVLAVFFGVTLLALLIGIAFALWERATRDVVDGRVLGYSVTSDAAVSIRFEVTKDPGARAFCIVRARGADGREVGRDVAAVDPAGSPETSIRSEFTLATTARAVTGEVAGCSPLPISKDPDHER
jgi:hypothetical protein